MKMKRKTLWALVLVLASGSFAFGDAATDALQKAPAAVQATVKKILADNKMAEFSAEITGGKTVYDLEYSIKGTAYATDIDPDGTIAQREVAIDSSVVPPEVMDAAKKAQPTGAIAEAAIGTGGGKMFYLIETKVGNDTHELTISVKGKVTADVILPPEAPAATPASSAKPATAEKKD